MIHPKRPFLLVCLAGTAVLAAILLSIFFRADATARTSLVDLSILPPVQRQDVRYGEGVLLQGPLREQTLTRVGGPYLLSGTARIPAGVTVRIHPDTIVAADWDARLVVEGTLETTGASFISNRLHAERRLWHGITAAAGGRIALRAGVIADASAGLTCAQNGSVTVQDGVFTRVAAAVVSLPGAASCTVDGATVTESQVGFFLLGGTPRITNVTFDRVYDGLRVFHTARPALGNFTVRRPRHAAIVYAASPDLSVQSLSVPSDANATTIILDGADAPAHRWNHENAPTGKVAVRSLVTRNR